MKFKNTLILFVVASAVAVIPVFIWTYQGQHGWIHMLHAPLFGLTLAIAVATLASGWRSFQTDRHIKNNGFLFNDNEWPYFLPALGILLLTFLALISLGHDGTTADSNNWLLAYTNVRWGWVVCYGLVSLFWWLFCWLPGPSPTLGWKVSLGVPVSLLFFGGLTSGYGYFNLDGLILAGATFSINLAFLIVFALLSAIVRHNNPNRN